jgi:hypothetical protein
MAKVELEELVVTISGENKKLISSLNEATKATESATKGATDSLAQMVGKADKETDRLGGSFSRLGQTIESELGGRGSAAVGVLSDVLSGPLVMAFGAAAAAAAALKGWLELTLNAERNEQISNSFEALAASAGIASDALREGLMEASGGLADDDEILRSANRAIVQLGENASVIPQTMELARKATALFGGDLVANFEAFNDAIATGNTRLLKQFGIVIDTEEAERKYAASIGMTGEKLNEAGRKQALMNAALEQGADKLKNVDEKSIEATESLHRLGVAMGNIGDNVADAARNSGFFSSVLNYLTEAAEGAALAISDHFGPGADDLRVKLRKAQGGISDFSAELANLKSRMDGASPWEKGSLMLAIGSATRGLEQAKREFADIRSQIDAAESKAAAKASDQSSDGQSKDDKIKAGMVAEQQAKLAEEGRKHAEELILAMEGDNEVRNELLQEQYDTELEMLAAARENELLTEQEHKTAIQALDEKFAADKKARDDKAKAEAEKRRKEELDLEVKTQQAKANIASATANLITAITDSGSRAAFIAQKAAAIAQSIVATKLAAAQALAVPPAPNIALAGLAETAGAINTAAIVATGIKGLRRGIDEVPGVGFEDNFPAILAPGERVVPRETNRDLKRFLSQSSDQSGEMTIKHVFEFANLDGFIEVVESKIIERGRLGLSLGAA